MKMKVMLVDDHLLFLEGLKYLLETYGINVVGKAKDGNEALAKAHILKPDIILMDIRMPNCDGLEAVRLINIELPYIKVIMLTTSEDEEDLFNAIKYGASGYLLKDTDGKKLVEYLGDLENGEMPLSPGLALRLMGELRRIKEVPSLENKDESEDSELTSRQIEVLELVSKGLTYKEVGDRLGISERTVKYHIDKIIDLLHLENKAQAIYYAAEKGLLQNE
jgi:two-component system NarL family response regulator